MKIAYIVPSLINQGPIIVVQSLVKHLASKVECIDVFYFDEKSILKFDCHTEKIDFNTAINFDKYDIIHSHCLRPDRYLIKWKNKINKAKTVTTLHQDTFKSLSFEYPWYKSIIYSIYWLHIQSKFRYIISISNQITNKYNFLFNNKIHTIYNGCEVIDKKDFIYNNEITNKIISLKNKGYKLIGNFAYITKRKGLLQVLKSLYNLKGFAFIIIGNGPELINLKEYVDFHQLKERVLFLDYQNNPRVYLDYIDVYVMPSYSEGFGLAMVESALEKKAIVCSDIPSFHEIFPSKEVLFFKLNNIEELSLQIHNAYNDRENLGWAAYNRSITNFTASIMANSHLEYYNKILTYNTQNDV